MSSSARQLPRKHANSFRSSPNFFKNFLQVFSTTKSTLFHLNTLKSSSPSLATPFVTLKRRPRGLVFSDPNPEKKKKITLQQTDAIEINPKNPVHAHNHAHAHAHALQNLRLEGSRRKSNQRKVVDGENTGIELPLFLIVRCGSNAGGKNTSMLV